jgi:SSS family solute:Na+ symporter
MPEGPAQLFDIASKEGKFSLGSLSLSTLSEATFWVVLLNGLTINLQNFGIDQSYVQRYLTARSDRDAGRSVWLGALLYVPISAVLFFIGTGLFAFYRARGWELVETKGAVLFGPSADTLLEADKVFPHFIVHEVPVGVTGILIAAVLAAAMSSVDSSLNSSATLVLRDLYRRYVRPQAGERESMRVLYGATLAFGVVGTATALAMIDVKSALDNWWKLSSIFSGGMLGLFLLGLISRKARNPAAVTAVCAGVLAIFWMSFSRMAGWPAGLEPLRSPFHEFLIIVVGTVTVLLIGFLVTGISGTFRRRSGI